MENTATPCTCGEHDTTDKLIGKIGLYYTLGALLFIVLLIIYVRSLISGNGAV